MPPARGGGGVQKVLNVAEKPSVAKEISRLLSGNPNPRSREGGTNYNRVYEFGCQIQGQNFDMLFTSVLGHLHELEFVEPYCRNWGGKCRRGRVCVYVCVCVSE
jgi:DNA topoisomerase-3